MAVISAGAIVLSIVTGKTVWPFSAFMGRGDGRRLINRANDPFYYWLTVGMLALFLMIMLLLLASP